MILDRVDEDAAHAVASPNAAFLGSTVAGVPMEPARRRRWPLVLKVVSSAGLITFILSKANLSAVFAALGDVRVDWLLLAFFLQVVGPMVSAARWSGLLAALGVRPSFAYLYRSILVSQFFKQILPSTIGGDAVRARDAWKAGASVSAALTSVLLDRLLGLLVLVVFVAVALALSAEIGTRIPGVWIFIAAGLVGLVGVMAVMILPSVAPERLFARAVAVLPHQIAHRLTKVSRALLAYRSKYSVLSRAMVLSIFLQAKVVLFYFALAMSLNISISFWNFFIIVPIATFVMMTPISINGIGLREGVFIFLLGLWGVDTETALAFAWLEYGTFLLFAVVGGVVYALRKA